VIRWFGDRAKALIEARARKVGARACDYMAGRARFHAPKDTHALEKSIRVVPAGATFTVYVGVDYALPVHFGHLAGSTWVAPNPFLWRAVYDTQKRWPAIVREVAVTSSFGTSGVGDLSATF
jgi:hypothetical protein